VVVAVSLVLGWLFGIVVLFFLWFRSLPAHEEGLTLWIAAWLLVATAVGYTGFRAARARMEGRPRAEAAKAHLGRHGFAGVTALLLAALSWEKTESGWIIPLYPADLSEANLTRKPPGTVPFDVWLNEFEPTYRAREKVDTDTDLTGNRDYIAEATARYNAPHDAPDLVRRDLRNASMTGAFLPDADLRFAQMQGANLRRAEMQGAVLLGAKMQGAGLTDAKMQGTVLLGVEMQGAVLSGAKMQGAVLTGVKMQGAVLDGAKMGGANCGYATFRGALFGSADITCNNLTLEQLDQAVGDSDTVLPDGLTVVSCLETLPRDVEEALAHHPEEGNFFRLTRAEIRDALLCDRDADGNLTEQPRRVGRSAAPEQ
jgi:uncharacterized protein YjbI with pentapeptide repeats